jgi:hypothetical protein
MLGGFSGGQRPNSDVVGAGKKAGACPDEAQSTAEVVSFWKAEGALHGAGDAYAHSDASSYAQGRNAGFEVRTRLADSHHRRGG